MDLPDSDRVSVPRRTQVPNESLSSFAYGTVTLYGSTFQKILLPDRFVTLMCRALQPHKPKLWFGLLPFRSPLLWESFLFLGLLRCFSSPRSLCNPIDSDCSTKALTLRGFPHSEILGYSVRTQLPEAYRSVPRPSSAFDAKASTVRP